MWTFLYVLNLSKLDLDYFTKMAEKIYRQYYFSESLDYFFF